jgi:hypothetical protein
MDIIIVRTITGITITVRGITAEVVMAGITGKTGMAGTTVDITAKT